MKKPSLKAILTAFLMIAPFHGQSSASVASPTEGISQIELIKGKSYDPRTEEGRGFRQFFSGIAVAFAGPNINLEKKIQERLERPDLKIYFPSPLERERIGKAIANEVRSKILSHGYSNETVLLSLRKITESLVKKIISRIMEKEGITNPGRAAAWSEKLLVPFQKCISYAKSYPEGEKCGEALEANLVPNIGLALLYENGRSAFGEAYTIPRIQEYRICLQRNSSAVNSNVRECTLRGLRRAALGFGRVHLLEAGRKNLPEKEATKILDELSPSYERCLSSAAEKLSFVSCGDELLKNSAPLLVERSVFFDPKAREALGNSENLKKTAEKAREIFRNCLARNEKQGKREENGLLSTLNCELETKKETIVLIVERKALNATQGKVGSSSEAEALISRLVKGDFTKCLGSDPDARLPFCTRELAKNIAALSFEKILPEKLDDFFQKGGGLEAYGLSQSARENLISESRKRQKECFSKEVKSPDLVQVEIEINSCLKNSIRELTLSLGTLELSRAAKENEINLEESSFLEIRNAFQHQFAQCLDRRKPDHFSLDAYIEGMDLCQNELTKTFSSRMANLALKNAIRSVLGEAQEGQTIAQSLETDFDQCLEKSSERSVIQQCVSQLKAKATIALAREGVRNRTKKELGGESLPQGIKDSEASLDLCMEEGKKSGEECAVEHVQRATVILGNLILDSKLRPELGARYQKLEPEIRKLEHPFRECVLKTRAPLDKKFLEELDVCGTTLTENALEFLLAHAGDEEPATSPQPAVPSQTVAESDLADMMTRTFLCLNNSLSAENQLSLKNARPLTLEGELLKLVAAYVNYDVQNARGSYEEVLAQVSEDLKAAGPESARRKLLDEMIRRGLVDQLMKSIIRTELEKSLSSLPTSKRLPAELEKRLLDKSVMESALNEAAMRKIRPLMAEGVLKPILVDGKSFLSLGVIRSFGQAKTLAMEALLESDAVTSDEALRKKIRLSLR